MKELIRHLWDNNRTEIVSNSILNCHAQGLHSVMLINSPHQTVRLYVAVKNNELWKNAENSGELMSVGYHPHHCDITLHVIKGQLFNQCVKENPNGKSVNKYKYQSQISTGKMGFTYLGPSKVFSTQLEWINEGETLSLKASDIHTVVCNKNELTAWFVYEGQEDENYNSLCYSNAELDKVATSQNMYEKPAEIEVQRLLEKCSLLNY